MKIDHFIFLVCKKAYILSHHVIGHIDLQCVDVAVQAPAKIAM
jgi:hypothetical protein